VRMEEDRIASLIFRPVRTRRVRTGEVREMGGEKKYVIDRKGLFPKVYVQKGKSLTEVFSVEAGTTILDIIRSELPEQIQNQLLVRLQLK